MTRLLPSGDTALVVEFGDTVDRTINAQVLALADRIAEARIEGVVEQVPTFRSLMVHYDPTKLLYADLIEHITPLLKDLKPTVRAGRRWALPVCYEGDLAPDLEAVSERLKLAPEEVVRLHTGTVYHVYSVGFLPGFPYMGDLPERLALPRRESPRLKVPMGAVCMAMRMTGVYSLESPGGWHLLGRTPVRLFDRRRPDAVLFAPGDQVRFVPIPRAEYDRLDAMSVDGALDLATLREAA
jgi:KipI family sensor histidine kinase inhibitor